MRRKRRAVVGSEGAKQTRRTQRGNGQETSSRRVVKTWVIPKERERTRKNGNQTRKETGKALCRKSQFQASLTLSCSFAPMPLACTCLFSSNNMPTYMPTCPPKHPNIVRCKLQVVLLSLIVEKTSGPVGLWLSEGAQMPLPGPTFRATSYEKCSLVRPSM